MVTVAIIGILAAIAYPSYTDYVLRGRIVDATNALSAMRAQMEQHYQDNRTYATVSTSVSPCMRTPTTTVRSFTVRCETAPTATTYTITARGSGQTAGFVYTIDQQDNQATPGVPSRWGSGSSTCWITKRGACSS